MNTFPVTTSTLSSDALGTFIKENYLLGEHFECKLFRTGINHTYFLNDNSSKYAVRVYCYKWRTKEEIEAELSLLLLLKQNNISISFPIADKNGNFIQEINAPEGLRYVVLFSFAKGEKMRFMTEETCSVIGSLMAKIHNVTANRVMDRMYYSTDVLLNQSYNHLKPFFSEDLNEMQLIKQMGSTLSKTLLNTSLSSSQKGIVHLDIWYDNLSVLNANEITIFDFDNCGNGAFILDVGYFCKQLFFIETDKTVYESKVASFLKGYQKVKPLSNTEIQLIPEAGASIFIFYLGVQAQRFDWSNIFLSENYLKMFVGRIKSWLDYYEKIKNKKE
ncbi:phosphotransferase [uncultured Flavobacterium sp.]|uniref:phosphotransferase n=1 Tax=uncultured Flavobacterium sp. TaxID=165435 RepID=UPI0030EC26B8|tara:strand:+ start:10376 stop:11371 length:996 start_codon:yes stop_codon:yes gene_type:complete